MSVIIITITKTKRFTMKSVLTFSTLLTLMVSSISFAQDLSQSVLNHRLTGKTINSNNECVLEHRQLSYSYPELFISATLSEQESEETDSTDAGLVEVKALTLDEYQNLLFGTENISIEATKGLYNYRVEAIQKSQDTRIVTIQGTNSENTRSSTSVIKIKNNKVETITIEKQRSSWFSGWKKVFSTSCVNFK